MTWDEYKIKYFDAGVEMAGASAAIDPMSVLYNCLSVLHLFESDKFEALSWSYSYGKVSLQEMPNLVYLSIKGDAEFHIVARRNPDLDEDFKYYIVMDAPDCSASASDAVPEDEADYSMYGWTSIEDKIGKYGPSEIHKTSHKFSLTHWSPGDEIISRFNNRMELMVYIGQLFPCAWE